MILESRLGFITQHLVGGICNLKIGFAFESCRITDMLRLTSILTYIGDYVKRTYIPQTKLSYQLTVVSFISYNLIDDEALKLEVKTLEDAM